MYVHKCAQTYFSTDKNPFDLATTAHLVLCNRQSLASEEGKRVAAHCKVTTAWLQDEWLTGRSVQSDWLQDELVCVSAGCAYGRRGIFKCWYLMLTFDLLSHFFCLFRLITISMMSHLSNVITFLPQQWWSDLSLNIWWKRGSTGQHAHPRTQFCIALSTGGGQKLNVLRTTDSHVARHAGWRQNRGSVLQQ